jgi:hypothetical protein
MEDEEHLEWGQNMEDEEHLEGIGASESISKDADISYIQISDKVSPSICNRSNDPSPIHI